MNKKRSSVLSEVSPAGQYLRVFGLAVLLGTIIYLPFLVIDKGMFVYYGDYNVQQIPFYQMCHDMIRSGDVRWNWYTDLGSNFIGSYAFYLIGSPFFWLTIPFPSAAVPYLMAPLMILKLGTASVASFGYLRRFVRDPSYAFLGALMYAFSGYSIYNIFFNHFHEVIAFFPLLLIGIEEFFVEDRRGVFALAVGLMATVNYYFFFGEVVLPSFILSSARSPGEISGSPLRNSFSSEWKRLSGFCSRWCFCFRRSRWFFPTPG